MQFTPVVLKYEVAVEASTAATFRLPVTLDVLGDKTGSVYVHIESIDSMTALQIGSMDSPDGETGWVVNSTALWGDDTNAQSVGMYRSSSAEQLDLEGMVKLALYLKVKALEAAAKSITISVWFVSKPF